MTPDELATELGVSPKTLRAWLRRTFPRSLADKQQRWHLDATMVDHARQRFGATATAITPRVEPLAIATVALESFDDQLDAFSSAAMHTRAEVLRSPSPVPSAPGVYGWWFRRLPMQLDTTRCLVRDECTLLYTGISPRRPPANGRSASTQTLRTRINTHYTGNAEGSTLRKTLGCLLSDELGIELRRVGSGKRMTFLTGERTLSAWMAENALVSWVVDETPWVLEEQLIAHLDVPLNLDGNSHNQFHPELSARRARAVGRARELPVVPNPGVGGA